MVEKRIASPAWAVVVFISASCTSPIAVCESGCPAGTTCDEPSGLCLRVDADAGGVGVDAGLPDSGVVPDGGASVDAGSTDAGSIDGGSTDAGPTDAGSTDAGSTDAGSTDAGSTDAGSTDAGSTDAGSTDAGALQDAGTAPDAGILDGGRVDGGADGGARVDGGTDAGVVCVRPTFATRVIPSVPGPIALAAGDFTSDGLADLVVANIFDGGVSVFAGIDGGAFVLAGFQATGRSPYFVRLLDLDFDGRLDAVIPNQEDNSVTVLTNLTNDAGLSLSAVNLTTGIGPVSVELGLVNADPWPDIMVANLMGGTVSLFLTDGGPRQYGTAVPLPFGVEPHSVTLGRFTGDQRPSLAVGHFGGSNVHVRRALGDGGFAPAEILPVGSSVRAIVTLDVNGDERLDLVTTDFFGQSLSVLVAGDGGFASSTSLAVGSGPAAIATGDLNADGNIDLVVANSNDGTVTVLLRAQGGGFHAPVTVPAGASPFGVSIADFNRDGRADIAVANLSASQLTVLLQGACGP
jgi:hypothetical protein